MSTAEDPSKNQTTFTEQKLIYGQSLRDMLSFATVAESMSIKESRGLQKFYEDWLRQSEVRSSICFLDITFGSVRERLLNSALQTILLAPSVGSMEAYRDVLQNFFEDDFSLAAHPVFRAGLPVFCRKKNGSNLPGLPEAIELIRSEDSVDLESLLNGLAPDCELYDDGMLVCSFENECSPTRESLDLSNSDFEAKLFQTFKHHGLSDGSTQSTETVKELWGRFTDLLDEERPRLISASGFSLGTVYAAPVGVRDPGNPRRFSWIADVYVGFDCKTEKEQAQRFIGQLFLQLMRTNSALKTRDDTTQYILRTFGHEIKQVTQILGESWVVSPSYLLDTTPGAESSEGKIGTLSLHPDFSFLLEEKQLLIVPFGQLLRAAQQTIDLWSWQNGRYDLPKTLAANDGSGPAAGGGPLGELPQSWPELLRHAWSIARDQKIVNDISGGSAYTPEAIRSIRSQLLSKLQYFVGQVPKLVAALPEGMKGNVFLWRVSGDLDRRDDELSCITASFAMVRLLVAWFSNCVQHGDPTKSVRVEVKPVDAKIHPKTYRLTITNTVGARTADATKKLASSKLSSSMHGVRLALEELQGSVEYEGPFGMNQYKLECQFSWSGKVAASKERL